MNERAVFLGNRNLVRNRAKRNQVEAFANVVIDSRRELMIPSIFYQRMAKLERESYRTEVGAGLGRIRLRINERIRRWPGGSNLMMIQDNNIHSLCLEARDKLG